MSDKFIEDIKNKTEKLEIPDSLSTDNMMRKIIKSKKKNNIKMFMKIGSACAAGLLLMVGLGFAANVEKNNSDKKANEKVATAASYKEIYSYFDQDMLNGKTTLDGMISGTGDTAFDSSAESTGSTDFSKTNVQVEGVDEGDTVKTDGKYIYALDMPKHVVRIFDTSTETVQEISTIEIPYNTIQELYVSNDKLVVICATDISVNTSTIILTYDITDRKAPVKTGEVNQDGYFSSSRMVNDVLYTFTNYYMYQVTPKECVPTVNGEAVEPSDVYLTCDIVTPDYQIITSMDINSPNSFINNKTILGNYSNFYVSNSNIYVASSNGSDTQIIKLSYDNGIINGVATGSVKGYVLNSYSLDEYQGNLRVVTTKSNGMLFEGDIAVDVIYSDKATTGETTSSTEQGGNSLYVLNDSLVVVGSIEDVAPGESVRSVRFMGDTGYFVTFKNMDPLFSVDLSNPISPKILGELHITGFSEYLHSWSDGLLLGVGQEVNQDTNESLGVKLSMFNTSDNQNVTENNKIVIGDYDYTQVGYNQKSILVDKNKNLIGFYAEGYSENSVDYKSDYLIYSYSESEGFQLVVKENVNYSQGPLYDYQYPNNTRGLFIDNKLYIVNPSAKIAVYSLEDYSKLGEINW